VSAIPRSASMTWRSRGTCSRGCRRSSTWPQAVRRASTSPPGASSLACSPIPARASSGEEREVRDLAALLRKNRLITLTGAGGSGKSRLALALAHEAQADTKDGVWWIDLASVMDAERVPSAIASGLGVREQGGVWILDTLEDYLAPRSLVLVLDCCEHVLGACRGFAEVLLPRAPDLGSSRRAGSRSRCRGSTSIACRRSRRA
jgi:hypothetical protein